MNKDLHSLSRPPLTRRSFLRGAGMAAVGIGAARRTLAGGERRELCFIHTHTGEHLTALYYDAGAYCQAALARVNELLRDFRTETVFPIDPQALDRLYALQVVTGRREPFEIISGYRSPVTNAALRRNSHGVAEHSLHMQGRAIDARLQGYPTSQLAALARAQMSGGTGFYRVSDFIHVDTGAVRIWGDPI
ncbi:MAG: DUF882 domain-containing protein [Proteobacteria bacterium]|nr:DUF882 domain-containing protein [Pseudomonadota bacterium]